MNCQALHSQSIEIVVLFPQLPPMVMMNSRMLLAGYGSFRLSLRKRLQRHPGMLGVVRALRAIWVLGPWQKLLVRYHQKFGKNSPLPRNERSIFDELDIAAATEDLKLRGFALNLRIPPQQVNDIRRFCDLHPGNGHTNPHLTCEAVRQIAFDPKILEVASRYLGAEPILYQSSLYWSLPGVEHQKPRFHYDIGDYRSLVLFIYLTDVDEQSGPHLVIEGTHHRKTIRQLLTRFLSNEDAYRQYPERIRMICGTSGEGFFEDLTCYHKRAATTKKRLMLTVSYMLQRAPLPAPPSANQPSDSEEGIARLVQTS